MEKMALELWTSKYNVKDNIFSASSALQVMRYDYNIKTRDLVSDHFFLNWKYRKLEGFTHHLYQFKVWKKSMKSKFIAKAAFLVLIALIF